MLPVQLAMPLALLVGAAIAAKTGPSRSETLPVDAHVRAGSPSAQLPEDPREWRMLRISIGPGAALPWHRHAIADAGYLLEGELRLETLEGVERVMRPGDSIAESGDVIRSGTAGPEGATVVVFYAEAGGEPVAVAGV
ncbi:cupin domain-containing protein [Luteibacter yeojuensis]